MSDEHNALKTLSERDHLSSLPPEVLLEIFRLAAEDKELTFNPISRTLEPYHTAAVYRHIHIGHYRGLTSLANTISVNPYIGTYVQVLQIMILEDSLIHCPSLPVLCTMFATLSNLTTLDVIGTLRIVRILQCSQLSKNWLPQLRNLQICGNPKQVGRDDIRRLYAFNNFKKLTSLTYIDFAWPEPYGIDPSEDAEAGIPREKGEDENEDQIPNRTVRELELSCDLASPLATEFLRHFASVEYLRLYHDRKSVSQDFYYHYKPVELLETASDCLRELHVGGDAGFCSPQMVLPTTWPNPNLEKFRQLELLEIKNSTFYYWMASGLRRLWWLDRLAILNCGPYGAHFIDELIELAEEGEIELHSLYVDTFDGLRKPGEQLCSITDHL